jgi:hypothetical protein
MKHRPLSTCVHLVLLMAATLYGAIDPGGFNGARWGQSPDQVKSAGGIGGWQSDQSETAFPPELKVTVFRTQAEIAGYNASVRYYFQDGRFFQATVDFQFNELKQFDFNYNVFRSVHEYYTAIRTKTVLFVNDIYDLLREKYGKKKPVFKGLDPQNVFEELDRYVAQERWNLRYHPYDFYTNIIAASYARWDFPHTRVLFSMNIAAAQKRFDYQLSLSSVAIGTSLKKALYSLRAKGL